MHLLRATFKESQDLKLFVTIFIILRKCLAASESAILSHKVLEMNFKHEGYHWREEPCLNVLVTAKLVLSLICLEVFVKDSRMSIVQR